MSICKKEENITVFNRIMSFFLVIFLVILAMGILFSVIIDNFMEERALNDRKIILNEAINTCEYILKENSDILISLTEDETVRYILREYDGMSLIDRLNAEKQITQISNSYTTMRPEIAQIKIFKEKISQEMTVQESIYDIEYLRNDDVYKNVVDMRASLVPDYTLSDTREKMNGARMAIVSQIVDYNGEILGYMCVEINKSVLYKRCVSETLLINKYIIDESGNPIITPGNDENVLYNEFMHGLNKTGKFTYESVEIDGKKYIALCSARSGHGWRIINLEKESDFYSWRKSFIWVITVIFLALILIFALVAYYLSVSISKPIVLLSEAMETSAEAKESREFKEIHILQKRYNYLLKSQEVHIKEIEKYSAKQREAEIKSMIAQINPHFVFNTLSSIAYKALEDEQAELCSMIGKLGKLCKISYNLQSFLTTVEEEIMYVSLYMDLQKMCFDDKFQYDIEISDDVKNIRMPRFILQPFVENSIVHGFENIKYMGQIKIKAALENEKLVISIADNGCGIEKDIIDKLNRNDYNTEKYGVRNVRERIEQLSGAEFGVEYLEDNKKGTTVLITLPGKGDEYAYSSNN